MQAVRQRGVWLAEGCGTRPEELEPKLDQEIRTLYADSKQCLGTEMTPAFLRTIPVPVFLRTRSQDRTDYILHPTSGEQLDDKSAAVVKRLRTRHAGQWDVQIVISDGLNANALMDPGHLLPYLTELRAALARSGYQAAPRAPGGHVRPGARRVPHRRAAVRRHAAGGGRTAGSST